MTFCDRSNQELVRINTSSSKSPFVADPDRQYKHGDGSWYDRNMVAVTNIESAKAAIQTIVEQGEGSTKAPRPPTEFKRERVVEPTPPLAVRSHYEVFEELYRGTPSSCHKLLENPKTKDLSDNETFYPVRIQLSSEIVTHQSRHLLDPSVRRLRLLLPTHNDREGVGRRAHRRISPRPRH